MSSPSSSSSHLVSSAHSGVKDYSSAFATLSSSYGFAGHAPVIPSSSRSSSSSMKSASTSFKGPRRGLAWSSFSRTKVGTMPMSEKPQKTKAPSREQQFHESYEKLQRKYGFAPGLAAGRSMRGSL